MRAVLAALAALAFSAGAVSAADTLGGTLSVGGSLAIVRSTSTVAVRVTLIGTDVTAMPATFTLQPGESGQARLTGPARGTLAALLEPADLVGDHGAAQLVVNLTPPPASPDYSVAWWSLLSLAGLALVALLRRWRPWELRITRSG